MYQKFFLIFVFFFSLSLPAHAAIILAEWNFPVESNDALVDSGTFDNLTQRIGTFGTNAITFLSSGVASASSWTGGENQKYWIIPFHTTGYENITFSTKLGASASGPRDFSAEYRVGETGNWQTIPEGEIIITNSASATNSTLTVSLPENTFDRSIVFVRLLMKSNLAVNLSPVGNQGTSRIDDVVIKGNAISDVEDEDPVTPLCIGPKENISLSEILPYPKNGEEEYVELYNSGDTCVNLSSWRFTDGGNHHFVLPNNTLIEAGQHLTFIRNFYLNNTTPDSLTLFDAGGAERGRAEYTSAIQNYSYGFNGSEWLFSSFLTPGAENIFDEGETEEGPTINTGNAIINELLPNPKGDEVAGEYIELFNPGTETISLQNWVLHDTSKTRFVFTDQQITGGGYLLLPRSIFKFSLNNTGNETVTLLRPDGSVASTISYADAKENFSYSFNSSDWRYTEHLTPGTENKFSKEPKVNIKSKKRGFAGIPLEFKAQFKKKYTNNKTTYLWNFGDNKTSRLATPKHTYDKTGKHTVTVTLKNGNKEATKKFTVHISDYPKIPLTITRISPNPKGKDTGAEWIEVQNLDTQEVELTNWKVATGPDEESLRNHNFKLPLILPAKSTYKITNKENSFTLNNTASVIELRYPNGETANSVSYSEEKILDDAICYNINGICDFEDTAEEKKSSQEAEENSQEVLEPKETPTDIGENNVETSSYTPPAKELLKSRIKGDLNELLNIYVNEFLNKE